MKEKKEFYGCSGLKKRTHHEILPVRTREHTSCGERPPGDVCNEIGVKECIQLRLDKGRLFLRKAVPE